MDEDRWTLVQKKTTQKLQTDCNALVDAVETPAAQKGDSKLYKYESSATESQCTVVATNAHGTPVEQTSINSLIGMPFIIRSYQDAESKADENLNDTRKLKSDDLRKSSSVRGLLRIDPSKLNHETVVESNGQEVRDMSEMNEVDWPSISGYHNVKEDYCENVPIAEDSKSWSTVLRTVSLPQPIKKVNMTLVKCKKLLASLPGPSCEEEKGWQCWSGTQYNSLAPEIGAGAWVGEILVGYLIVQRGLEGTGVVYHAGPGAMHKCM